MMVGQPGTQPTSQPARQPVSQPASQGLKTKEEDDEAVMYFDFLLPRLKKAKRERGRAGAGFCPG